VTTGVATRLIIVFLLAVGAATPAEAGHGKIDTVDMTNGDHLTCEIVKLFRGILTVKTDAMGTISVEWNKVRRVVSPAVFEVESSTGLRYYGALGTSTAGRLQVGAIRQEIAFDEAVGITALDSAFWQQLDGSIAAGFSFTQANQQTQWSLDAALSRRTTRWLSGVTFSSLLTSNTNTPSQTRNSVGLNVQRYLPNRWFAALVGQFDENEELGLRIRSVGGASVGLAIIQTNRSFLGPFAGVAYTREEYTGESAANRAELLFGARMDWFTFGDRSLDFTTTEQTFVDLSDASRVRVELTASMKRKVIKDLYWALSYFESFNSTPPEGNKKNDSGLTASFGWSF
jgi:hypothetical protein